jgi:hypothetical protein
VQLNAADLLDALVAKIERRLGVVIEEMDVGIAWRSNGDGQYYEGSEQVHVEIMAENVRQD